MIDETKRHVKLIVVAQLIGPEIETQLVTAGDVTRVGLCQPPRNPTSFPPIEIESWPGGFREGVAPNSVAQLEREGREQGKHRRRHDCSMFALFGVLQSGGN